MCVITATELKNNLGYYLTLSNKEDIYVTKNKKIITILVSPKDKAKKDFFEFAESLPEVDPKFDYDKAIKDEISKRCGF